MRVHIATLGCRLNQSESDSIGRERVAEASLAELQVVNACAVTHKATRESRQAVRAGQRAAPQLMTVVTGCASQNEPEYFEAVCARDSSNVDAERSANRAAVVKSIGGQDDFHPLAPAKGEAASGDPHPVLGLQPDRRTLGRLRRRHEAGHRAGEPSVPHRRAAGLWSGLADNFVRVFCASDELLHNHITRTHITSLYPEGVMGTLGITMEG